MGDEQIDWRVYEALTNDVVGPKGATRLRRLDRLADYLATVPRKLFDMERYGRKEHCGTVCCLAGHATRVVRELRLKPCAGKDEGMFIVNTRTDEDYDSAFASAFGLDIYVASYLTDSTAPHRTPKQAAKAVRRLAAEIRRREARDDQ